MVMLFNHPVGVSDQDASVVSKDAQVWSRAEGSVGTKEWVVNVVTEIVNGAHLLEEDDISRAHER